MKKKTTGYLLLAAAAYIVLLVILTAGEGAHPEANIKNFGDALWYSVVTLTTVGYGDRYPVSPAGRVVGFVFVILSIGLLAAVIFAMVRWIRGRILPFFRLKSLKGENCCLFSECNAASEALASDILKNHPSYRMVFCGGLRENAAVQYPGRKVVFLPDSVRKAAAALADGKEKNRVFLVSEDPVENYADAKELSGIPVEIYCRAQEISTLPEVHFFDAPQCCARLYWQKYPLGKEERCVIIAGDGAFARAILEQAVLSNCRIPFIRTEYHVFGDWKEYRNYHPELYRVLPPDEKESGHDMLLFREEEWNADSALLRSADRLIFCSDDPGFNASCARETDRCFALKAKIYAAASQEAVPQTAFGAAKDIFTEELVIRSALDLRARLMHEDYCGRTGADGPSWEELPLFLKESNRAAADHQLTKLRLLLGDEVKTADAAECRAAYEIWRQAPDPEPFRQNEHERWLRFYTLYNWTYGPEKDEKHRRHPCIVRYEALSEEEREKDDSAWEKIGFSAEMGEKEE